jgi:hypothetical protein
MTYPWQTGDALLAADLNAAIASAGAASGGAVNALAYGADPTGVEDSAAAINAAAAILAPNGRRKSVYLPAGSYHVRSRITLSAGQTLFGDGRGNTIITISDDFNPAETVCVIALDGGNFALVPGGDQPGPIVRDLGISFQQPASANSRAAFKTIAAGGTSTPGGTGVRYPWAIATISRCRPIISRVRISAAWDGITTNGIQAPFWLDTIEMGALDCGLSIGEGADGVHDFSHITGYHFWPFGMDVDPILTSVYTDLQTVAMRVGVADGLEIKGFTSYSGRVVFTSAASITWATITNMLLDNSGARLEISAARYLQFVNFSAIGDNSTGSMVKIDGGIVGFSNWYSVHQQQAQLEVTGGDVAVNGAVFDLLAPPAGCATITAGALRMSGVRAHVRAAGAYAQPLLMQTGTGVMQIDNVNVTGVAGSSGTGIQYYTDVLGNLLGGYTLASGWTVGHVTGQLGDYGTAMPMGNFATDALAAAGGVPIGRRYRNGSVVQVRVT